MAARELASHGFFLAPLLQPGFDVLDAGCGPATITTGIAEVVFPGTVTGLDISAAQLEQARRLTQGREIMNLGFVSGSAGLMPFADESFDVVFSHALLEHLVNPMEAMREFHRVTRPGGFIALCSPDWNAIELTPHAMRVGRAVSAYRNLQERCGGNPCAGARLRTWMDNAGFTPLTHDEWIEEYDDTGKIAEYLAARLSTDGQFHHATSLRDWASEPGARFRQSWKFATGVRADAHRHRGILTE